MDGLSSVQLNAAQVSAVGLSPIQSQQTRSHPAMDAAAKSLGMSTSDLRSAMQSGQSLASIASSKGISEGTLTAAMATAIQQAHPEVSADQAANVATAMVTRTPTAGGQVQTSGATAAGATEGASGATATQGHHHHHHDGGAAAMNAAAQTLGMSASDLESSLNSGQSLSSLASSKGVSQDDLVKAMAGALTQTNPSLATDQATQLVTQLVNRTPGTQDQTWSAGTQQPAGTFSVTA